MKKFLFVFLASFALFSCGSDDSGSGSDLKPTSVKVGNDTPVSFTYDEKNRMQSLTAGGETRMFTYNSNNRLDKVISGDEFLQFIYDDNGKYDKIVNQNNDILTDFEHITENTYTINGQQLSFEKNGDWKSYGGFLTFSYSKKKGPFANVKHFNALALTLAHEPALYYASMKRRESLVSGGEFVPVIATEGEKGLPSSEILDGITIQYQYGN